MRLGIYRRHRLSDYLSVLISWINHKLFHTITITCNESHPCQGPRLSLVDNPIQSLCFKPIYPFTLPPSSSYINKLKHVEPIEAQRLKACIVI